MRWNLHCTANRPKAVALREFAESVQADPDAPHDGRLEDAATALAASLPDTALLTISSGGRTDSRTGASYATVSMIY